MQLLLLRQRIIAYIGQLGKRAVGENYLTSAKERNSAETLLVRKTLGCVGVL